LLLFLITKGKNMWFEVFKTGEHTDSSGNKASYSEAELDKIATLYNSRLKESDSYQAPVVKGHPKTDDPAFGWVEMLKRKGSVLFAKIKQLAPEIIDEIKQGHFKNISIALYPDMLLRHIGLLGAIPPAVKGLKPVSFSENDTYNTFNLEYDKINCFDDSNSEEILKEYITVLEKNSSLIKENEYLKAKLLSFESEKRINSYREFASTLLRNKTNQSGNQTFISNLVDILEMAYNQDRKNTNEFSTESEESVNKVKEFALSFVENPLTKEFAVQNENQSYISNFDFSKRKVDPEKLELHNKAIELQMTNSGMSYQDALKMLVC